MHLCPDFGDFTAIIHQLAHNPNLTHSLRVCQAARIASAAGVTITTHRPDVCTPAATPTPCGGRRAVPGEATRAFRSMEILTLWAREQPSGLRAVFTRWTNWTRKTPTRAPGPLAGS